MSPSELPSLQIFNGLEGEELEFVLNLLTFHRFDADDVIARQGEVGSEMFIIAEGRCAVEVETSGGPPFVLAEFDENSVLGEMALIDIKPRSATVRAVSDVALFALSNQDFLRLWEENLPSYTMVVLNVARELSRRLRHQNNIISAVARAVRGDVA